jgi:low temperature requirement protein LtrA
MAMENIAVDNWTRRREVAADERRTIKVTTAHGIGGGLWFGGWMFTIGYAQLVWWKVFLGVVVWPLFLGIALR